MSKPPKRPQCPEVDKYLDFQWRAESIESDYRTLHKELHAGLAGSTHIKIGNCYRWIHYSIGQVLAESYEAFVQNHSSDTQPVDSRPGRRDPIAYVAMKALAGLPETRRMKVSPDWVSGFASRLAVTHDNLIILPLLTDSNYPESMRLGWLRQWLLPKDRKSWFYMPAHDARVQAMRDIPSLNTMIVLSLAFSWGSDRPDFALPQLAAWCAREYSRFWSTRQAERSVQDILQEHLPELIQLWQLAVMLELSPQTIEEHLVQQFGDHAPTSLPPMCNESYQS
jgi:hypothetical protein